MFIPFQTIAGFTFNPQHYSSEEIEHIIKDLSDPYTNDNLDAFYKARAKFHQEANQQRYILSDEEIYALERFQDDAYQSVRDVFRRGIMEQEASQLIKVLDSAFENGIKFKGIVYRGESLLSEYGHLVEIGDVVSPSSFLSTSISQRSAYVFHNGQMSRFELLEGVHGIVIPSVRDDELEVLINRNSYFEVTAINTTPEGNQIVYKELTYEQIGDRPIKDFHTGAVITAEEACSF